MARITFEPPANRADWERACNYFHVPGHPYYSPNTLDSPFAPCDLTIDPTKPETWARAVYEAGVKAGRREGVPLGPREPHGPSPAYRDPGDSLLDLDARLRSVGGYFRERVTAVDARIESLVVNGVEYRPVNP